MAYKNYNFNQFLNLLIKKGKKSKIQVFIFRCFLYIKIIGKNPGFVFIKALANVTPIVGIKNKKVKGKMVNIPNLISKKQKNAMGIKWILKSTLEKKNKFCKNLAYELIETAEFRSSSYKKKLEISLFLENNIAKVS